MYLSKSQSKRFHGCLDLPSDVELLNFGVVFNQHFEGELAIKIRHFETFPLANQRGRNQDSEVKILEHLRLALLQEMIDGTLEPGHSREVTLWSERTPCPSCQFALAQFVQFFDDLGVSIQFKVDWDRTNHPEQVEWHDPPDQGNFKAAVNPALHEFFWRGDPEGAPHPVIYSDEWWTTRVS